jgi:GNAT superfamily N-acetyltransferase
LEVICKQVQWLYKNILQQIPVHEFHRDGIDQILFGQSGKGIEKYGITNSMIRQCNDADFDSIYMIINEAAEAYRDVIPDDRWHDPYMSRDELAAEIADGVIFWGADLDGRLVGVMGIQEKGEVTLIRHAYVQPGLQKQGIGAGLLHHFEKVTDKPILIGTWADASWAISFYRKNSYQLVTHEEKTRLLKRYWSIPDRQVETSVVLADRKWFDHRT